MTKANDADTVIKNLIAENQRLETANERLRWKNYNQRGEIRRLNKAIIAKNYLNDKWSREVEAARSNPSDNASN
jgi:hypothetical protein